MKGLLEFQLHHLLCSWGSGGRKSWKVRTLQALGLALPPPLSLVGLSQVDKTLESSEGQSPRELGPGLGCRWKIRAGNRKIFTSRGQKYPLIGLNLQIKTKDEERLRFVAVLA